MNVVGLGNAGCKIAKHFENYSQYSVYFIDQGLARGSKSFGLTKRATHEDYDKKQIRMSKFVDQMSDHKECLFIMAGSGDVSGASLQVLKFRYLRFLHNLFHRTKDL